MTTENTVTRFDVFTRAANEIEGTEEREVIRLFNKRKLVGEFDLEDVVNEDWETGLTEMLQDGTSSDGRNHYPTLEEVVDFLGEEPEDEDGEESEGGSVVPNKYRILYGSAQNCGDEMAIALTAYVTLERATKKNPDGGLDRAKLREVAAANGISDRLANWEARGLNGGLLRMNTSNVLRGMIRHGAEVRVGNKVWQAKDVEPKKSRRKGSK